MACNCVRDKFKRNWYKLFLLFHLLWIKISVLNTVEFFESFQGVTITPSCWI